eukprot:s825_g24.t1
MSDARMETFSWCPANLHPVMLMFSCSYRWDIRGVSDHSLWHGKYRHPGMVASPFHGAKLLDTCVRRGWSASRCEAKVDHSEGESEAKWCLEQSDRLPTEREVDTYSVRNEAIFYACEGTLGRNGPEMAEKLLELKEAEAGNLSEMIRVACREAGRCASKSKRRKGKGAEL